MALKEQKKLGDGLVSAIKTLDRRRTLDVDEEGIVKRGNSLSSLFNPTTLSGLSPADAPRSAE